MQKVFTVLWIILCYTILIVILGPVLGMLQPGSLSFLWVTLEYLCAVFASHTLSSLIVSRRAKRNEPGE